MTTRRRARSRTPGPRFIRHKLALLNWVAIYPLITVALWSSQAVTAGMPLYFRTLLLSIVLVIVMNFAVMPMIIRLFASWLRRGENLSGPSADGPPLHPSRSIDRPQHGDGDVLCRP